MAQLATAWAIFQGLLLESLPFLLIGVGIASMARWLAPGGAWLRQLPGVWAVLQQHFGVRLRVATEQWRAVVLERDEAQLLATLSGTPVLSHLRLAVDVNGAAVEWRQRLCLTDRLALTLQHLPA